MNEIEMIEDSISDATKTYTQGMPAEQMDGIIEANEKALGNCDRLLNHEMLSLEKHIGEMESIMNAPPEEKKKMSSLMGSMDDLNEILINIHTLSEARKFLAARNAAMT